MAFVYYVKFVPAAYAQKPDVFTQVADIVHPGIGCGVDLNNIRRVACRNFLAGQAFITGLTILWTGTVDRFGKQAGGAGLASAARSTEEVGMYQSIISHGVPQSSSHGILTDEI